MPQGVTGRQDPARAQGHIKDGHPAEWLRRGAVNRRPGRGRIAPTRPFVA